MLLFPAIVDGRWTYIRQLDTIVKFMTMYTRSLRKKIGQKRRIYLNALVDLVYL